MDHRPASPALSDPSPFSWKTCLGILGILAGFVGWCVWRYGVDVPFADQWTLTVLLDQYMLGELGWLDLWLPSGNHRQVLPNIMRLALAGPTGWNVRVVLAVNFVLACLGFVALAFVLWLTARRLERFPFRVLLVLAGALYFSISQVENWLWAWQNTYHLCNLGVLLAVGLLTLRRHRAVAFAGAVFCGFAATFSFANGLLIWPLGLFLIALDASGMSVRQRVLYGLGWMAAGGLAWFGFFYQYRLLGGTPPPGQYFMEHPGRVWYFFLTYLASPLIDYFRFPFWLGALVTLAGMGAGGWLVWRLYRKSPVALFQLAPLWALGFYGLGSAWMTASSRAFLGIQLSGMSRYITMSSFFWHPLLALLLLALFAPERPPTRRKYLPLAGLSVMMLLLLVRMVQVFPSYNWWESRLQRGKAALYAFEDEEALHILFPDMEQLAYFRGVLKEHQLGPFRPGARKKSAPPGDPAP